MRHIHPEERKTIPRHADPSGDPPTRKRDEWKARIRTERDSKAPSGSIATSTCRKAGARKHTRNVVTTPGSVRGEEKRLEQAPVNRPEERMGPQDTASHCPLPLVRRQGNPKAEKRKQPDGEIPFSSLSINPQSD